MKQEDVYPSRFLKAEDLDDELTLTITRVEMATLQGNKGEEQHKPIVFFQEVAKGLIINKTNWKLIAGATGEDDSDNWKGKQITLFVIDVDAFGDVVAAIRVKKSEVNCAALMKRYLELYEKARKLDVEGLSDFVIDADADAAMIIDAGKQLRALVIAAEAFM